MKVRIISFSLLFLIAFGAFAEHPHRDRDRDRDKWGRNDGHWVHREEFIDMVALQSVYEVCDREPYFRDCLEFTELQCRDTVMYVTPYCQDRLFFSMPKRISREHQFIRYGMQFNRCISTQLILRSGKNVQDVQFCMGY